MDFAMILYIFPAFVLIASVVGFFLIKKWFAIPLLIFIIFFILTFTVFNESFFIWVIVYTVLSIIIYFIMLFITKAMNH